MAINITNEAGTIKVEITSFYYSGKTALSPSTIYFNKAEVDVSSASNYVILKDYTNYISILYSDITTPSGASADAIANVIQGYINVGGSGKTVEIDFGNNLFQTQKIFNIIDLDVFESSSIIAELAYKQPTGKSLDELEMDDIIFKCKSNNGSFDLMATSLTGSVYGNFFVNYLIK